MFESIDLNKKLDKKEYNEQIKLLEAQMGRLQRECKELGIPILIVFEGYGAAGKGLQIGKLIHSMDPRGFEVHTIKDETYEEKMYPFMWRFWTKTPVKGKIAIFGGSWYRKVLIDRFEDRTPDRELEFDFDSINSFERQLTDDGNLIIKLLLIIDKEEQKKRFDKLEENIETAWRVTDGDRKRNEEFERYSEMMEEMLFNTDTDYAPWTIIESVDRRYATIKIYNTVIKAMTAQIKKVKEAAQSHETAADDNDDKMQVSILSKADLSLKYSSEEYRKKLDYYQKKIELLHSELYRKRIPVVICFEGWDASGKGGAIKRLTDHMDPRGYVVHPTAAPNDIEKAHHYLWRFWRAMPKAGHISIFDRTWYGRVMVERIEKLCSPEEWRRAYREINEMEEDLYDEGAVIIKFWMHIDKDEQEKRFKERQADPDKQWKITDEDWRNREKWDKYEIAVNEMIMRTSTEHAPWIIVEGNDKYYARIKVLKTVTEAIEKRFEKEN